MEDKKQMQDMYERLMEYEKAQHERNQKRIKTGIKLLWIVPIVFLALLFITDSSKTIFLTLWIVSLFGIAIYLVLVEYLDNHLQKKMHEINGSGDGKTLALLEASKVDKKMEKATGPSRNRRKVGNIKKVMQVFLTDARRLATNVVALVIVMGLSIIPALYAWFNILSNWDPYGESATSQMQIAVFSEDEGVSIGSLHLCIGDTVIESLESNNTIGWVFSETKEEALEGVHSGAYYAALVMPEEFTTDMISFLSGSPKHPTLQYYENSKKNAIATKITSKVKTTVQQEVNATFIGTLAEVMSETGNSFQGKDGETTDMVTALVEEMEGVRTELDTYISILDGLIMISKSTGSIVDTSKELLPNMEKMIDSGSVALTGMEGTIVAGAQTIDVANLLLAQALNGAIDSSNNIKNMVNSVLQGAGALEGNLPESTNPSGLDTVLKAMDGYMGMITGNASLNDAQKQQLQTDYDKLRADVEAYGKEVGASGDKMKALADSINADVDAMVVSLTALRDSYATKVAPDMNNSIYKIQNSIEQVQVLLTSMDDQFINVAVALQSYGDALGDTTQAVTASRDYVVNLQGRLENVIQGLTTLSEDPDYQEIVELLQTDPETVAEFMTSPVVMETETIYEISNYGSAMAPFYTVLAIWVGALIMVALIHVKVIRTPGLEEIKFGHEFFGRFITFFLIGQTQALITVLGDLFFVQIQCVHPFKFWLAASVISFTFVCIMYGLTVAFGNVGEAIAVVIMVIQVAGAGCTFPIEVLPGAYQAIYRFLPFVYSMDALKSCVGGAYQNEYWICLGVLAIYALVFLCIGLFLKKPFAGLNELIERSKEKSGVML